MIHIDIKKTRTLRKSRPPHDRGSNQPKFNPRQTRRRKLWRRLGVRPCLRR
jgi:hypothetical protein